MAAAGLVLPGGRRWHRNPQSHSAKVTKIYSRELRAPPPTTLPPRFSVLAGQSALLTDSSGHRPLISPPRALICQLYDKEASGRGPLKTLAQRSLTRIQRVAALPKILIGTPLFRCLMAAEAQRGKARSDLSQDISH